MGFTVSYKAGVEWCDSAIKSVQKLLNCTLSTPAGISSLINNKAIPGLIPIWGAFWVESLYQNPKILRGCKNKHIFSSKNMLKEL